MPTGPDPSTAGARQVDRRRIVIVPGGPMLVEGPVELVAPDGETVCSDRFVVAVCQCRRSKRYPLCDTSHRRKVRTAAPTSEPSVTLETSETEASS